MDDKHAAASPSDAGARPPHSILVDRDADMRREMRAYLDTLTINGDNIGNIRRSLFMPFNSQWNGWVRDDTAAREKPALSHAGAALHAAQSSDRAANRVTDELLNLLLDPISGPLVDESAQDFDTIGPMLRRPDIQRFIAGHIAVALETYSGAAPHAAERPREDE